MNRARLAVAVLAVGGFGAGCTDTPATVGSDLSFLSPPVDFAGSNDLPDPIDLRPPPDLAHQSSNPACDGYGGWGDLDRMSPVALHDWLSVAHPYLINVHIPWAGDIANTDARIAYTDIDAIEAFVHQNHCAEIVLYCYSGPMSLEAGNKLIARGYLRVHDLAGGLIAWKAAGYPVQM